MDLGTLIPPSSRTRSRRAVVSLAAGATLALSLLGPVAPVLAADQSIISAGPLTLVRITDELNCAVNHTGDSAGEFYGDTACATLVAVGGTLFGPTSIPAGSGASPRTPFTPVSQTAVTGAGTAGDPFRIVTVVDLGTTGLRITETDSYVVGQEVYRTDVAIANSGAGSLNAILYRAGDCYLQNSDNGFGAADPVTGAVSCVAGVSTDAGIVPGSRIEQWYPLSPGSFYEATYSDVWAKIGTQTPFDNICERCANYVDNGAGLSWTVTIPAGGSVTRSHLTVFSPLGIVPLTTTKSAAQPSVAPGAADSYTITVTNPNTTAATLTSITDTLPAGFSYTAGTTTGATTTDPVVAGQDLTWSGTFVVPASGSTTLTFGVTVSATPGVYTNQAGATGEGAFVVLGSGQTASVTVTDGTATPTPGPTPTATPVPTPGPTATPVPTATPALTLPPTSTVGTTTGGSGSPFLVLSIVLLLVAASGLALSRRPRSR